MSPHSKLQIHKFRKSATRENPKDILKKYSKLFAVGDATCRILLDNGVSCEKFIFDGHIQKIKDDYLLNFLKHYETLPNKRKEINFGTLASILSSAQKYWYILGEEDLITMAIAAYVPNSVVFWGDPIKNQLSSLSFCHDSMNIRKKVFGSLDYSIFSFLSNYLVGKN